MFDIYILGVFLCSLHRPSNLSGKHFMILLTIMSIVMIIDIYTSLIRRLRICPILSDQNLLTVIYLIVPSGGYLSFDLLGNVVNFSKDFFLLNFVKLDQGPKNISS